MEKEGSSSLNRLTAHSAGISSLLASKPHWHLTRLSGISSIFDPHFGHAVLYSFASLYGTPCHSANLLMRPFRQVKPKSALISFVVSAIIAALYCIASHTIFLAASSSHRRSRRQMRLFADAAWLQIASLGA